VRGLDGRGRSPVLQSPTRGPPVYQSATGLEVIQLQEPCMRGTRPFHLRVQICACSWIRRADSPFPFLCFFVFAFCMAVAIALPADTGKSGLRTRSVSEFRGASWLCSLYENPPLSRSSGAGTNPDQAEKQHAPHSARQSAHQHTPNRKQEAQQGGFTIQLICPTRPLIRVAEGLEGRDREGSPRGRGEHGGHG
jgi:hypothetical protein